MFCAALLLGVQAGQVLSQEDRVGEEGMIIMIIYFYVKGLCEDYDLFSKKHKIMSSLLSISIWNFINVSVHGH